LIYLYVAILLGQLTDDLQRLKQNTELIARSTSLQGLREVPAYQDYDITRANIGHGLLCGEENPFWTHYQDGNGWKSYEVDDIKSFRIIHRLSVLSRKLPCSTLADEPMLVDEMEVQRADQVMKKLNKVVLYKYCKVNNDLIITRAVSKRIAAVRGSLILSSWLEKHKRWANEYRKDIFDFVKQALAVLGESKPTFKNLLPRQRIVVYQKLFHIDVCCTATRFLAALNPVDVIAMYRFEKEGKPWRQYIEKSFMYTRQ